MKDQIAVTGATGFIGRHLVLRMQQEGYRLRCLVRPSGDTARLQGLGVDLVCGDLADEDSLRRLVREVDVVVHLAGQVSVSQALSDPSSVFLSHAVGTLNVLEAIRQSGEPDCAIIYASSDKVYGTSCHGRVDEDTPTRPSDPYGISKLSAENLCQAYSATYSIPFTIVRAATTYGPCQEANLLIPTVVDHMLRMSDRIAVGNLDVYRSFVYVEDLASALQLCISKRGEAALEVFNVAASTTKVREVLDVLLSVGSKYLAKTFHLVQDARLVRPKAVENREYELDCSKAERILGWKPHYSLPDGLEATLAVSIQARTVDQRR